MKRTDLRSFRAREGDFIETVDNLIFDVKGLVHPPDRTISYVRYVQDPVGDRCRNNKFYKKIYSLNEREKLLERKHPQYLYYDSVFGRRLEGVPIENISVCYEPVKKVFELLEKAEPDEVERQATELIQRLHDSSDVSLQKLGLSGSILVELHNEESDIDPIVYGRENCKAVYEALKQLKLEGDGFVSYNSVDLKKLYRFRSKDTQMSWRDFKRIERRKASHGRFEKRDFSLRFIVDWNEVGEEYGDRTYVPVGYAKIKARVVDDSNSIFTPCSYRVSDIEVLEGVKESRVEEIVSFRSRFCEQAVKDEIVVAQGKVEKVTHKEKTQHFRLILGSQVTDFMVSLRK